MARAFDTEVARSIASSLGRFLAIAGIVALGCGFYAGLRMTGPDMRLAADAFYDGTHLYDVRILGTLGFDEAQVSLVRGIEGVQQVAPSKSTDVMAQLGDEQYAIRVSTFDAASAAASTCEDDCTVLSDDEDYLNRLVLAEGRWPAKAGECLLSADRVMVSPVRMGDAVEVMYGTQDLDEVLAVRRFTVVGTVHSSLYVSAVTQGSTTLGSGQIDQFMFVTDASFDNDCPYTELFVRAEGAEGQFSGDEGYQQLVEGVAARIESQSQTISRSRLAAVRSDAHARIDEEAQAYDEAKQEAEDELGDAREQLADAREELDEGAEELQDAMAQLDDGQAQLDQQRNEALAQLDQARAQLEQTQSQLDDGQAQLDASRAQVEAFAKGRAQLAEQLAQAQEGLSQAHQAQEAAQQLALQLATMPADDPARAQAQAQLDQLNERMQQQGATVEQLEAGVAQLQEALDQGDAALEEFNQRQQEVSLGYEQLAQGWTAYYQQLDEALAQLDDAQAQLDDAQEQIDQSQDELAQGQSDYEEGLQEFNDSQRKAASELADAAQVIANARADADALELPDIYVLDRSKNYGVASVKSDSERIDHIARVFPFIFFLVAALVALTTMTRMVDEDRVSIGTLKALGYSRSRITGKYLVYAGVASMAGAALGIAVLSQVLPAVIQRAYAIIYNVPATPFPLPIDVPLALLAAGMGVGVTLLATWGAMASTLREQPARLMLPRAPKPGKRILLERIGPLWRRLSFSQKVTSRNLLRYKKRLGMTVVGIAGCTALLLTGFGLHDAIWDIIDKHFDNVVRYHIVVQMEDDASEADFAQVQRTLVRQGQSSETARAADLNMQAGSATHDPLGVTVTVAQDPDAFAKLVYLRERATQQPLTFGSGSVVLTEKLARTLGVGAGGTVELFDLDEIGNATGKAHRLEVSGIAEYYVGNAVFLGPDAYAEAYGATPTFGAVYANCTSDEAKREALNRQLRDDTDVQTIAYNDETIDSYRTMLSSVNMIVVVLVVAAAALAFIVLYNLTNINIMERRREIASLKVLGFTPHEVNAYIFRETLVLSVAGALLGLALGVGMESFVVESAEVDYVMFGRDIHLPSFAWAFAFTVGFSVLVMMFMRRKLRNVSMVESLKSVD